MKPNDFSQLNVLADADFSHRSAVREERHPNAVTAPPVNRGSMTPRPWRGFWNSLGTAALVKLGAGRNAEAASSESAQQVKQPWQRAAAQRRLAFMLLTVLSTVIASSLFAGVQPDYDNVWLEYGQIGLYGLLSGWVVTGFVTALMGFYVSVRGDKHALSAKQVVDHPMNPEARTAIIMPICNEDVATVFAGLRATCESVAATGHAKQFDVFVLSDSYNPETAAAERAAWEDLRAALADSPNQPQVEVYYRLRTRRTHRKAGNVADFCRRWGKDYRYMVVLDADSVMSGDCLTSMVKLMEANPTAGIIQTATQAIGHVTLHARAQQFASRVTGRLFTLGMQFWQLGESHYWGHNAIIRVEPFMKHCALAPIKGTGGMSGGIMSHDFVEAALMRRAGYNVWLVSDLVGSYEQQPPDLLAELQRDRRWCQGNLQNARLMAEPGIHRCTARCS
jgi:membrane glycosyltransferase